jgi:glyoxylase-like metal-dependent hydrolase (beta-lactamase superfamily II)
MRGPVPSQHHLAPDEYDPRALELVPAARTRRVSNGDIVDPSKRSFEVPYLPGHSPCSIALWHAR